MFLLGVSTAADAVQLSLEERIAEETGFWSDYQKFTIFQAECIKAAKTSGQSKQAKSIDKVKLTAELKAISL